MFLYHRDFNLDVDMKNYMLYVRTDVGCWKLVFNRWEQKYYLYHRNYVNGRIVLEDADKAPFHNQKDFKRTISISKCLRYIEAHDRIKAETNMDYRKLPTDSRQQKIYVQNARRRERRRSIRRVDNIFSLLENQNEGLKKLSFC